jgi:hypothetical protein
MMNLDGKVSGSSRSSQVADIVRSANRLSPRARSVEGHVGFAQKLDPEFNRTDFITGSADALVRKHVRSARRSSNHFSRGLFSR